MSIDESRGAKFTKNQRQHRIATTVAQSVQNVVALRATAALDHDFLDGEAGIGGEPHQNRAEFGRGARRQPRLDRLDPGADNDHGQRRRRQQPPRQFPPQTWALATRRRGAATPSPATAGGCGRDTVAGPCTQSLHLASSTIQSISAGKSIPAWAAISGTRDIGVRPGWVLISSNRNP